MRKPKIKKDYKLKSSKVRNEFNKFKNKWKQSNIGEKILTLIMLVIVGVFICGIAFVVYIVISAPEFDIENLYTKEASIIYDAEGNEIARLGTENRERVTYDELPEVFIDALVATEDSRFFQHNGVDMARFLKATVGQLLGKSGAGGASTLTMQIAKQRFNGNEASGIKGIIRKFSDIYISVFKLEKNYTKEQLIEFYVNIPDLGSGSFGIEQASQTYFGKSISEVTLPEAAMLVGLFQAPTAYNPFNSVKKAEARRNQVLNLMQRHGYITAEECENAKATKVEDMINKGGKAKNKYQGFINTVVEEAKKRTGKNPYNVSMKIYSTMIPSKQDAVNDIYDGVSYTWPNDAIQAGIAVTDVDTGALIAVGTGRNKGELVYNYATMIKRHPGSSAKPIFDYGPAIEYLNWSTGTTIVDDQYTYSNGGYMKNWDNGYKGIMTAKTALAASRNIPALQAFQAVNQSDINKFVTGLGITPEYDKVGYINESHSIGGFDGVNPLQMAAAYAAFARGGVFIEPYSFTRIEFLDTGEIYTVTPEKRTVMSEATAFMINMILKYAVDSNNITAGSKSGTDIASKTGTSTVDSAAIKANGIKASGVIGNSWQVTYSPKYVCAVWVGYDQLITKEHYLTSKVGGAARKKLSQILTKGIQESGYKWKKPSSVVSATIELETIPLALASNYTPDKLKSVEYFKSGTVPDEESFRFAQLANPTDLKANYTLGSVELTWSGIKTPNAIDVNYLTEYFKKGYKTFADKYLKKRLTYNEENIGTNGYHVYISNSSGGYTDLGFTTNTHYTYNGNITGTTTFLVKSSYSKFKSNMSSGVSIKITPTGDITPSATNNWKVELNGPSEMSVQEYYNFINSGATVVKITDSDYDVTINAKIATTCWDSNNEETSCETLDCNNSYTVQHTAFYNNKSKSVTRSLSTGC